MRRRPPRPRCRTAAAATPAASATAGTATGQCLTGPADGNRVRVAACGGPAQNWTLP